MHVFLEYGLMSLKNNWKKLTEFEHKYIFQMHSIMAIMCTLHHK
jgi:hypothetical protein